MHVLVCVLGLAAGAAWAAASAPWMPDAATRHDIEWLVDEAGLDLVTTQWPLPAAAVAGALDRLPAQLPPALGGARERVRRALQAQALGRIALTARGRAEAISGFGDDATPGSALAVHSGELGSPDVALQLGARLEDRHDATSGLRLGPEGSAVATELFGVQLQAWSHRSWWGPGWQNSLVLGSNPPALPALGIQRASASTSASPWLAWLGPWNAELFVARTEDAMDAWLLGQRLTLRPWPQVELGLTRTAQWGGEGRPQSLASLVRLIAARGTNPGSRQQLVDDPGNSMAGLDLRIRCPGGLRCAGYAQLIGEDEAGLLPSKYLGLVGLEHWAADGQQRLFAEYVDSTCGASLPSSPERGCAYRNWAYPQGYASDGRWIGAGVGPDSRVLTLGWLDTRHGSTLRLHLGHIGSRVGAFSPLVDDPHSAGRLRAVGAGRSFAWGRARLSAQLDWMRVAAADGPHSTLRLGLQWQMPLD